MEMNSRTSFGMYELMRMVIPGFYFAALLAIFVAVFFSNIGNWIEDVMGSAMFVFFATLVAGVSIYARESPKRRRAFLENQPSTYLLNRSRLLSRAEPLSDLEAQRLYFYILNNHISPAFHEKIFFFGTVYTVMINIRRTSFWFGLASLVGMAIIAAQGERLLEYPEAFLFAAITWGVYILNVRYNKADRKMQENYQDQIFWLQMHDDLIIELLSRRHLPEKG